MRGYLVIAAIAIALALPVAHTWRETFALLFLERVGELTPVGDVVERQQSGQALYGSALFEDEFEYKLALIDRKKPAILALGSSRALQLREEFFSWSFVNAGRAMNEVEEGWQFVDRLLKIYQPQVVIVTIDLWWLNDARQYRGTGVRNLTETGTLVSQYWQFVEDGKISQVKSLSVILGDYRNPISRRPGVGIAAVTRGVGFRPDGSRDYGARYFGMDPAFDDVRFENSLWRAREGVTLLSHGTEVSRRALERLRELLQRMRSAGITIVAVVPPFAPSVWRVMEDLGSKFAYVPKARARLQSIPVAVFDYSEAAPIGITDCEFADGLHAGDVAFQRILLDLVARGGLDASMVNLDRLRRSTENLRGRTVTPTPADGYRMRETDFLGLGCLKPG